MDLALDIGNSAVKGGLFEGDALQRTFRLDLASAGAGEAAWKRALADALDVPPRRAALASVVPDAATRARRVLRDAWGLQARVVRPGAPGLRLPFALGYRTPETLGADRLAAAAAAWMQARSSPGGVRPSVLAVDAGTALTYEVVRADADAPGGGVYEGGAIAPGPALLSGALAGGTAQLPAVSLDAPPASPLGASTEDALRSGLFFGLLDSANGMVRRLTDVLAGPPPVVVCTGGAASLLHRRLDAETRHAPHLVLRGIRGLAFA